MKNQSFRNYIALFLLPGIIFAIAVQFVNHPNSVADLIKIGILFPLYGLALRGIQSFFPMENIQNRSMLFVVECALAQSVLFAAFILLQNGFLQPEAQDSLTAMLRQFFMAAGCMSVFYLSVMLYERRKRRAHQA